MGAHRIVANIIVLGYALSSVQSGLSALRVPGSPTANANPEGQPAKALQNPGGDCGRHCLKAWFNVTPNMSENMRYTNENTKKSCTVWYQRRLRHSTGSFTHETSM